MMLRSSRPILLSLLLLSGATTQGLAQAAEPSAEDTAAAMEKLRRATMPGSQPATATTSLPNGASAINEVYEDWTVDCRLVEGGKSCRLSQAQGSSQTGRRVFALELDAPRNGRAEGTVLMPLGVKLDAGAIVKLDDRNLGQGLRFSACAQQGCIASITLPAASIDAMRKSQSLSVASLGLANNEPIVFKLSMKGFSAAINRLAQLDN